MHRCLCLHDDCIQLLCPEPERPEEDVGSPETRLTGGNNLSCRYWESNLGLLEKQPLLLTTESSPWPFLLVLIL